MIGETCRVAAENVTDNSLFVDYADFTSETLVNISRFFGVEPDENELASIYRAGAAYSKDQSVPFEPDSEQKRLEASALIRKESEKWAMDGYMQALAIAKQHAQDRSYL